MCHSSDYDDLPPVSAPATRFHVHGTFTCPVWLNLNAAFTLTLDAQDDSEAQALARDLIREPFDVAEIEEADV